MLTTRIWHIGIPLAASVAIVAAIVSTTDPEETEATIPAGASLVAVVQGTVSTARARAGDEVELRTIEPLHLRGGVVVPAGMAIHGTVTRSVAGGAGGPPELRIRFTELELDDDEHPISTEEYRFGTLVEPVTAPHHLIVRAGDRLTIRLRRAVTVEFPSPPRPAPLAE